MVQSNLPTEIVRAILCTAARTIALNDLHALLVASSDTAQLAYDCVEEIVDNHGTIPWSRLARFGKLHTVDGCAIRLTSRQEAVVAATRNLRGYHGYEASAHHLARQEMDFGPALGRVQIHIPSHQVGPGNGLGLVHGPIPIRFPSSQL